MANPVPGLNIPVSGPFDSAELSLAAFSGPLILSIPNDAKLCADGSVYAILGPNEVEPAWSGARAHWVIAGQWRSSPPPAEEDEGEYKQLPNLKVQVPKEALASFVNQTINLRYQSSGESSSLATSAPISLTVKP